MTLDSIDRRYTVSVLLIVSALLLSSLIPGGPVEHRDFSHIHPIILGAFNIFLTVLDLGSFALVYFIVKRRPWAYRVAFGVAIAYFSVYAVDLAQLFPQSPTAMSPTLALIEVLGMTVAVPLMFAARTHQPELNESITEIRSSWTQRLAVITVFVVLGLAIVLFATDAAMQATAAAQ